MKCLDLSLATPQENLALDEALLEECEENPLGEVLRFWESPSHFVVLGAGGRAEEEADLQACLLSGIPVLRRCTGGGTVVQGPGCLNYSLVLRKSRHAQLLSIEGTNRLVLHKTCQSLNLLSVQVAHQGTSDLALEGQKISGNAQRRKRNAILFHGTLLYGFDLKLVSHCLRHPPREPDYRARRPHEAFITNLDCDAHSLRKALRQGWECHEEANSWPRERVGHLVETKYAREEWNFSL